MLNHRFSPIHLVQRPSNLEPGKTFACIGLDGTIKTKEHDNFQRDWPNIIVSDDATIRSVDEKWNRLGLGAFIPSPALKCPPPLKYLRAKLLQSK